MDNIAAQGLPLYISNDNHLGAFCVIDLQSNEAAFAGSGQGAFEQGSIDLEGIRFDVVAVEISRGEALTS